MYEPASFDPLLLSDDDEVLDVDVDPTESPAPDDVTPPVPPVEEEGEEDADEEETDEEDLDEEDLGEEEESW